MTLFESGQASLHGRVTVTEFGKRASRRHLRAAFFLDRDGVVIEDRNYLADPGLIRFVPGALETLRELQSRFRIIIVTNQSGVSRGFFTEGELLFFHRQLVQLLSGHQVFLDAIYYCPHHPTLGRDRYRRYCTCRKPEPGMIFQAASDFGLDLRRSFIVGDKESDIVAGKRAGLHTVFLCQGSEKSEPSTIADYQVESWTEIVRTTISPLPN